MAERFRETVDIRPVDTRTGAAQAALSLADQLEQFKTMATQEAGVQAVRRGETRAAGTELTEKDGITQAPTMDKVGFVGSIEATAHNKALRGAYLASLSNDITESVQLVETENAADLLKFNDSVAGLSKGVLSGVDPSVRHEVSAFMDGQIGDARTRVHRRSLKLAKAQATAEMQGGLDRNTAEAAAKARAGDTVGSAVNLLAVRTITQAMFESGDLSETEVGTLRRSAEFGAARENKVREVADLINDGDYEGAINNIGAWRDKIPKGYTVDEHDEVSTALLSELRDSLALDGKLEDIAMKELQAEQSENFVSMFSGVVGGQVDANAVMAAAKQKLISMDDAIALVNVQNSRGAGVNDWDVILDLQERIGRGEDVRREIAAAAGKSTTGIKAEQLMKSNATKQASLRTGAETTLMDTPDAKREKKYIETVMGQAGMFEKFDPKMKRNLAEARREFEDRVLAGEVPRVVADSIIAAFDVFDQDVGLLYGGTENLDEAQKMLDEDFDNDRVDDVTYNTQYNNIQRRRTIVTARETVERERKAEDAGR